jgi:hypothetical protein
MRKYIYLVSLLVLAAALANAAGPAISLTTILPDTTFGGPYLVKTVIKCSNGISNARLGFYYNPEYSPAGWPYNGVGATDDNWIEDFTQAGDTFSFLIPAVPQNGLETPVKVGYAIYAENTLTTESTFDPADNGYFSFLHKRYTPSFTNTSSLRDTFFTGPFVVKTNIATLYGDSVSGDYIYSDVSGGADYLRDSLGTDGFYYYHIPRQGGGSQTPITLSWFLMAYDTMGNWGQYPILRDTMNHFQLIDPWMYNPNSIANTNKLGPFPVWTSIKSEGPVINDSLWIYDFTSGSWTAYPRDSMVVGKYYYTIPVQNVPVINPVPVTWHIKATDSLTGNYGYMPLTAPVANYDFYIFDLTPPVISDVTVIDNTSFTGPFKVSAKLTDTSGISQVRLYYRIKPFVNDDSTWNYMPMNPTGNANECQGTIPVQYPGVMVQYYVSGRDGSLDQSGKAIWNTAYYPAGGPFTPWHFFIGNHAYKTLLVNDALPENNYAGYYLSSLDTTGIIYGVWDNRKQSVLPQLRDFTSLVWFTGDDSLTTLTQIERDSLSAFLDRGGNLLLSSKNLGQNVSDTALFYNSYLKADFDTSSVAIANILSLGQNAPPLSHGNIDSLAVSTLGTAGNNKSIDRMNPLAGAQSVYQFKTIGGSSVIRCSTAVYKTVFSSIPLEAVASNSAGKVSRTKFIARSLVWFGIPAFYKVEGEPEPGNYGTVAILGQAGPNPFTKTTSFQYSLPTNMKIALKVYNILGQEITTIFEGTQTAGTHSAQWQGLDKDGRKAANGIYLYRLEFNSKA